MCNIFHFSEFISPLLRRNDDKNDDDDDDNIIVTVMLYEVSATLKGCKRRDYQKLIIKWIPEERRKRGRPRKT
jgi:hypothetical protein